MHTQVSGKRAIGGDKYLTKSDFRAKCIYIYLWAEEPTTVNKAREVFSAVSTNQNEKVPFYVKSDLSLRSLMDP